MATLRELIEEKNNRIETVPEAFAASVKKTQKDIYQEILSLLDSLERDGDKIKISKKNLQIVAKINDDLKQVVFESEYIEAVIDFAGEFDTQAIINDKYFKQAFSGFESSEIGEQIIINAKESAVELLAGAPLDTELFNPIKETLNQSVASGASFKDTLRQIREIAEGSDEVEGRLLQYSKTIAKTSFGVSDRAYTNVISEELDVEWYFYSGGLIDSSREFCIKRNGKYFHFKEIESWTTDKTSEGNPNPNGTWPGMIRGTNEQTIFINAGGWNCNHSIMPVGVASVPKEVIQRNISNGNYKPTEKEEEILEL